MATPKMRIGSKKRGVSEQLARVYPGPTDFVRDLKVETGAELYREAYSEGMSVSALLEDRFPEHEFKDGIDAFTRCLMLANVRTPSAPEIGIYASTYEEIYDDPSARVMMLLLVSIVVPSEK